MTTPAPRTVTGACLCGAVRFQGTLSDPEVVACHCGQCRRWSGHVWASFHLDDARIEGDSLRWFASSAEAERGFCASCGSSLFWRPAGRDRLSVSPGALDGEAGLRLGRHIFVADKGDYYEIADGLPQDDQ